MKYKFSQAALKILSSKNPKEYIDNCVKSTLIPSKKAILTRIWLQRKKKYNIVDINYARNRHPYWKAKKSKGSIERNRERMIEHDYSDGMQVDWNEQRIKEFINMNKKGKDGKFIYKDIELAKHFCTTIPSIQYLRRKYNLALRIFAKQQLKPTVKRFYDIMKMSEQKIKKVFKLRKRVKVNI